ncbi:glycosyl hydrolase family 28-related protein [Pararcticibacter amylolyticus]|uniref:Rhamnogalacturonase A/B/Epimerase-like pectate lyase domain-containing protein n=1 Tax=Pararcticibacter amylolyticus TaxID=2173175 RepID=A0A2U2PB79_9SPHI|nr:glycosyl hydrolase family 28-related protein [Pararcticibacter amylolyticus]PWG78613.1 hypothetical protein DDR33_21280 [Pararcticibacter amylolyticus]
MNRYGILTCAFLLSNILHAGAQQWRSKLYPESPKKVEANFYSDQMIQDFSFAGYHKGDKEIPSGFSTILDVTTAPYHADSSGKQDVTLILQKAIDDAASVKGGAVVFLPQGTYKVSPQKGKKYCLLISHSNTILRGAGQARSRIFNVSAGMRGRAILLVSSGSSWRTEGWALQRIAKDLMAPSTSIPVGSAKDYKPGDLIIIRNYINDDWVADHRMLPYWKGRGGNLGGLLYFRKVISADNKKNILTIDIPTRYALKTAQNSCVYKAPPVLSEVGIEDLSFGNVQSFQEGDWSEESFTKRENPSYESHDSWAVAIEGVYNGWIRKVASCCPTGNLSGAHLLSNGIKLSQTANVSILECDFRKPQFGGGGGNGYMYRIMGNENLIKDCRAEAMRHGFVLSGMNASGNVFFRCIDKDTGRQTGLSGHEKTSGSGSDHHMHFSHSNLFDQCTVENSFFAAGWRRWGGATIHGLTAAHSVYWNLVSNGTQEYGVQTQQGRYGYVIGTSGDKPGVRTTAWLEGTEEITEPLDYTEGIGAGATLIPQSLYLDQQEKRKQREAKD